MSKQIQYNANIPVQTISYKEKIADDFEWGKKTMRAYIERSYFATTQRKWWLKKLYDYYNGHIDIDDYKIITEPFGKPIEGDWADVVNYPIIRTKIDLLQGEFAKRPKQYQVFVTNDDVVNEQLTAQNQKILQTLQQLFVNTLNEEGVDSGMPSEQTQTPEEVAKEFASSYRDKRAMLGQNALDFIYEYNKLDEKFLLEWFHWLVSGEVYSYKAIEHNEPYYEVVNVLDIDYDKDPDNEYIEDGEWVVRRKYMNPSTIVEFFYDDLGKNEQEIKDAINKIETLGANTTVFSASAPNLYDRTGPQNVYNRLVEVKHIVWRSKRKVGICTFIDDFGQPQQMEVDENFKAVKDAGQTVEWLWVNEIWEGYLIGTDMYFRIRPIPVQRTSLDNLAKCKLPYNGRVFSAINSRNISLVTLGIPYQILYNATMHRLKLAMAKMKDDMAVVDYNWKPKNMSMDEWLLTADMTSILFVDYNKEGVKQNHQHQSTLRLASSTISAYIELLRFIKQEWDEVCGITRQREGSITSSETVGGVERAVVQSSLITEIFFSKFEHFMNREYQGLLDYSKFAWIEGKKTSYVQPDTGKIVYMDVDPIEHSEAEYGIFVANSSRQLEKLKKLEAQIQNLIQNGVKGSTIVDIMDTDNFAEMKAKFLYAEQKMDEYQQQMQQQQGEQQKEVLAMQDQLAAAQHERELEKIDRKGEWDVRKAEITAYAIDEGSNVDAIHKAAKLDLEQQQINIRQEELNLRERDSQRKADVQREKTASNEKIAKTKTVSKEKK